MKTSCYLLFIFCLFGISFISAQKLAEKEALIEGNIKYDQKNYKAAQINYEKALLENKKSLKAHYNLGNTHYNENNTKEAIKEYNLASKLTTDKIQKSSIYHNLGNSFMKQKDYQNAANAYKNSLKNNPLDNQTRYNYALAKLLSKKEEDKKPEEQKKKEKQQKDQKEQKKKDKEEKEKQEQNNQSKNKKEDKNNQENKGNKKGGEEQNKDGTKKDNSQKIDPSFSEGILRAVERQEQQTHKRMIEEQKTMPREVNKKDW